MNDRYHGAHRKTMLQIDPAGLLIAIAAGDDRSLLELHARYYPFLACLLSELTPRTEQVEQIIDDTFMEIRKYARHFGTESRGFPWIIGIAYHTALRLLQVQTQSGPAQKTCDCTVPRGMNDAVKRLPVEQHLTLALAYRMGCSLQDIAEITNVPAETVMERMSSGCGTLRQYAERA
jgi:RNA polymerase sigma-70 factor, ECF subfamily